MEEPRTMTVNGRTIVLPQFRANIPVYACPSRPAEAFVVEVERKFYTRIEAAIERDLTAIDFDGALNARARIDAICDDVTGMLQLDDPDFDGIVFYDPSDNQFYAYPPKK